MGKNGKFGKDYGKVVGKDTKSRPGWKGPGYVKKAEAPPAQPKKAEEETNDQALERGIPIELQQFLLNIFRDVFLEVLTSDELQPLLQDVKAALYERDFKRKPDLYFRSSEYSSISVRCSYSFGLSLRTCIPFSINYSWTQKYIFWQLLTSCPSRCFWKRGLS
jgi:hypothetical protein